MAFSMPMKQIGVKNIGFRVDLMEWSNKMDLIAIANEKGTLRSVLRMGDLNESVQC